MFVYYDDKFSIFQMNCEICKKVIDVWHEKYLTQPKDGQINYYWHYHKSCYDKSILESYVESPLKSIEDMVAPQEAKEELGLARCGRCGSENIALSSGNYVFCKKCGWEDIPQEAKPSEEKWKTITVGSRVKMVAPYLPSEGTVKEIDG